MCRPPEVLARVALLALGLTLALPAAHGSRAHDHGSAGPEGTALHAQSAAAGGSGAQDLCPFCLAGGRTRVAPAPATTAPAPVAPGVAPLGSIPSAEAPASVDLAIAAPRAPPLSA